MACSSRNALPLSLSILASNVSKTRCVLHVGGPPNTRRREPSPTTRAQILSDINASFYFGSESRQFLSEALILSSLLTHPCRVPDQPRDRLMGSSLRPHFYIIPVLWRAISYSSQPVAFRARAIGLMDAVVSGAAFWHDAEHHVLLHTSTAATSELWGRHAAVLIDPRIIVLHLEGKTGDLRPGK